MEMAEQRKILDGNAHEIKHEAARQSNRNRIIGTIAGLGIIGNLGLAYLGYKQLGITEESITESTSIGRLEKNLPITTECGDTRLHTRVELDHEDVARMCETVIKIVGSLGVDEEVYYDDKAKGHNRSAFVETNHGEYIVLEESPYDIPANMTQDVLLHEAVHAAFDDLVSTVLEDEEKNIEGRAAFVLDNLEAAFNKLQKINKDASYDSSKKGTGASITKDNVCKSAWSTFTESCFARDYSGEDTTYGHPFDAVTELTASGTNLLAGLDTDASKWWFRTSLKNTSKAEEVAIRQAVMAVLDFILYVTEGQPEKIVKDYDSLINRFS